MLTALSEQEQQPSQPVRTHTYPVVFKTISMTLASLREISSAQELDRVIIYINSRQKPVSDLLQKQDTRQSTVLGNKQDPIKTSI